jgi:hypothetical protein
MSIFRYFFRKNVIEILQDQKSRFSRACYTNLSKNSQLFFREKIGKIRFSCKRKFWFLQFILPKEDKKCWWGFSPWAGSLPARWWTSSCSGVCAAAARSGWSCAPERMKETLMLCRICLSLLRVATVSIKRFMEDQAPPPPPSPTSPLLPSASCLSFSVFLCVVGRAFWREKGGGGGGRANPYDREKAWSSVNHSILSGRLV